MAKRKTKKAKAVKKTAKKVAVAPSSCCTSSSGSCCGQNKWLWVLSEVTFFATLYYAQYLLQVQANLWVSSLILWVLINVSLMYCPVIKMHCK